MQNLLHFAGFHGQPLLSLLRGHLYMEVCKSKVVNIFFVLKFVIFRKIKHTFCVLHYRFSLVTITAYRGTSLASPHKSSTCVTLLRARRLLLQRLVLLVCIGAHLSRDIERRCAYC